MPSINTKESQDRMSPQDALHMLKDGNTRFTTGRMQHRDLTEQVKATAKDQYPFAVVLSCIDSRVAPELIFDQGIGDIFDIRIGGNVVNEDVLAGLEFACKISGAKLIAVIGHTNCGAIIGAIDGVNTGNLKIITARIKHSIDKTSYAGERTSQNSEYINLVTRENVMYSVEQIKLKSSTLKKMMDNNEISIVAGMYKLETGIVEFY